MNMLPRRLLGGSRYPLTAEIPKLSTLPTLYACHSQYFCSSGVKKTTNGSNKDLVFQAKGISKNIIRDSRKNALFDGVGLELIRGSKVGLLGHNGVGKSTLLKIISGIDEDYDGKLLWKHDGSDILQSKRLKVGYLEQEPNIDANKTVFENVMTGLKDITDLQQKWADLQNEMCDLQCHLCSMIDGSNNNNNENDKEMEELQMSIERVTSELLECESQLTLLDGWDITQRVKEACLRLRTPPIDSKCNALSGGQRRRVALAKLILSSNDILLLDEPTNHLDIDSVEWLESYLSKNKRLTSMIVTHDRIFMENVCSDGLYELSGGSIYYYNGRYSDWLLRKANLTESTTNRVSKLSKSLEKEIKLLKNHKIGGAGKLNTKGNSMTTGGSANKARMRKVYETEQKLSSLKEECKRLKASSIDTALVIPQGQHLKKDVSHLELTNLTFIRDGHTFFHNLSFSLQSGMVVGVVGPNGIGKSTLIRLIIGDNDRHSGEKMVPTAGKIRVSDSCKIGYIEQSRMDLNPIHCVWEEIACGFGIDDNGSPLIGQNGTVVIDDGSNGDHPYKEMILRHYVAQFGFKGDSQSKTIGTLSGGERNRVHLAKSLIKGCNVLILDEPSNDLDFDTLRKLEDCLDGFRGISIVVSHDRYFLDRVATHLIAFDDLTGQVHWFEGNYSEYLDFRRNARENFQSAGKIATLEQPHSVDSSSI